jgi:hypothetical protein
VPTRAAAADGYAHLPRPRHALAARLTRRPARGLCGALLTNTITHHAPACPTCAPQPQASPSRLPAAEAVPTPMPEPNWHVNAAIRTPEGPVVTHLELTCQLCHTGLCDVEHDHDLAALCNIAADHETTHHPRPPHSGGPAATPAEEGEPQC